MTRVKNFLRIYTRSIRRFGNRGRPWREYVMDVIVIVGIPLSLFFCCIALLLVGGVGSIEVDGKAISGVDAAISWLLGTLVVLPLGCSFVGTIAYVMHEKMKIR